MSEEYKPWSNPTKHVVVEFHLSDRTDVLVRVALALLILRFMVDVWRAWP